MSHESHLADLERAHAALERQISDATNHPGSDTLELSELKRRKLHLKDEIARLKTVETIH